MRQWTASNVDGAKYLGTLEFQDKEEELHNFAVLQSSERLVFGGFCNVCFLETGYILMELGETVDDTLQELLSDLETYYNDGPQYTSRIVCNERV